MTTRKPLDDRTIRNLKPTGHVIRVKDFIDDPDLKGFGVQLTAKGSKSFFVAFTSPEVSKRRFYKVGNYPQISLAEGRRMARAARQLINQGIDPIEEEKRLAGKLQREEQDRQAKIDQENSVGTVSELFDVYIRDLIADGKRSADQVRAAYERDIGPRIGLKKARDVTVDDCTDIIGAISDRGAKVLANRTRSFLRAAFQLGLNCKGSPRWRQKAPDFALTANPAAATQRAIKRERRGQRNLSKEEVLRLWRILHQPYRVKLLNGRDRDQYVDIHTRVAIQFLLATGQRVEEVLCARWSEFDREEKLWVIPAERRKSRHEADEPHLVPLTSFHFDILDELRSWGAGELLFPHKDGIQPRPSTSLSQAVRRLCARERFEPFQPRDIRRTWKTLAGSIGIDLELRNRIQGHAMQDVGSVHYDRYSYLKEKRTAMNQWSEWLGKLVKEYSDG